MILTGWNNENIVSVAEPIGHTVKQSNWLLKPNTPENSVTFSQSLADVRGT
jgi:hypothetical protein